MTKGIVANYEDRLYCKINVDNKIVQIHPWLILVT